jgi:hypothetical protein
MKKCYKIRNLFGPYLYNSTTPAERAAVEEHIDRCEKCADDLRSRRKILEKLKPNPQLGEIPQGTQEDFAWNVYRKIASDILRRRSRRVFLRRFVLQPSLAVLVVAVGITVGVFRFYPGPVTIHQPPPLASAADETDRKELRAALYVEEFFRRQGVTHKRDQGYTATDTAGQAIHTSSLQPPQDVSYLMQDVLIPDSRRRLEYANFINYSLGDPRRALAEYQKLVDDYPDTDAAMEARGVITTILDTGI